jgi:phosphoenolpyruvate---glycerone phosphotransferase subunit DhaL
MGQEITLAQIRQWLKAYAARIKEQEGYLTQLDAAIGDADHGANMHRGMRKICERLAAPEFHYDDISSLLRTVAMTLISSVGGAAGPLYGAFFLRAAQTDTPGDTIDLPQLASMFRAGLEGIQQRGKAQVGDKTMIDALHPAVEALEAAAAQGLPLAEALEVARKAADEGMRKTTDIQANRGRASYLGPRAIGHQDPGATSLYYMLETAAATLASTVTTTEASTVIPAAKGQNKVSSSI